MADPNIFNTPVAVGFEEAVGQLEELVGGVADANIPFAEKYGNPRLPGSPATLVQVVANDKYVRDVHGVSILVGALVRVVRAQEERIRALERQLEASAPKAKAGGAKAGAAKK